MEETVSKKQEETALAVPGNVALSSAVAKLPDDLRKNAVALFEQMTPTEDEYGEMDDELRWRPMIISVKQPTSRKYPDAAKNGDLYSNDSGQVFKQPLEFVPIYPYTNQARFQPGSQRPDCRSEDGKTSIYGDKCDACDDQPWKGNARQKCQRTLNIMAVTPDFKKMYVLQFKGASFKTGKSILQQAKNSGERLHQRVCSLTTQEKQGEGVYFVINANYVGPTDPATHETGAAFYDELKKMRQEVLARISESVSAGHERVERIKDDIGDDADNGDGSAADFSDL